jgi:hypothetical protein
MAPRRPAVLPLLLPACSLRLLLLLLLNSLAWA